MVALPDQTTFAYALSLQDDAATPAAPPRPGDWLRKPLWDNRALFAQVILAATLINLFTLASAFFSMAVYNKVVPANARDSLLALAIGMGLVLVFDFLLRNLRGYFVDVAGRNIDRALGVAIFDRLLAMKLSDRRSANGAFAGVLREFETLRDFFASATVSAFVDVPFILLFVLAIALVAPPLALVPLLAMPVVMAVAALTQPLLARLSQANLAEGLSKQGIIVETINGLETVKSSRAGPLLAARWRDAVSHHAGLSVQQRLVAGFTVNAAMTVQSLVYVVSLTAGVLLMADHQLTMGALVAATMLAGRSVAPLAQIATLLTRVSHTVSAYRALDRLMAGEAESSATLRRPQLLGAVRFQNVSFRYPGSPVRALDNVSFSIAAGERVALVGRVGSGKSTITRLALGLYQPEEGAVFLDDADVRQLHPDDLRANIGSVLQDIVLLSGSIRQNISLGNPAVGDADVLAASRLAGAHDFIGTLANGYDLVLADRGDSLSGGQRQAIALARALVAPRPLLLLDEPTSAMDMVSEAALIDRLSAAVAGQTVLLVTHRQSLLRLATRIIVIDGGRIVADGPRDAVLATLLPA